MKSRDERIKRLEELDKQLGALLWGMAAGVVTLFVGIVALGVWAVVVKYTG